MSPVLQMEGGRRIGFVRKFRINPLQAIKEHGTRSVIHCKVRYIVNLSCIKEHGNRSMNHCKVHCKSSLHQGTWEQVTDSL